MKDQPEAMRLSDALRESHPYPLDIRQAADELRRLHQFAEDQIGRATAAEAALQMTKATHALKIASVEAQRDALLEALKLIVEFVDAPTEGKRPDVFVMRISKARAAIAKAEGEKA